VKSPHLPKLIGRHSQVVRGEETPLANANIVVGIDCVADGLACFRIDVAGQCIQGLSADGCKRVLFEARLQLKKPIARWQAIVVGEAQESAHSNSRPGIPCRGRPGVFLLAQGEVESVTERGQIRILRRFATILHYDHLEVSPWVVQAGERAETCSKLGRALIGGDHNRKEEPRLTH
jgi:hypothetical protein